ncbi:hypothetical protein CEUSTIGMA_g3311.t1 [Chlamydomonas eustigma]|uniref:Uncharacterized protein n=1 Tax=Chlamydomonas eustigma TaxID=1157962 RepID=A0A250WYE0_9CHLO|nr:hypothetical protein CEUSTIGMA_g3311.t1 [Chlamydomonas eustigma]|eukprot:GAX75868.1 hypothetical protein CEUSTIGMA_g3311.t1 [Chlamydomonas eustigma]
MLDHYGADEIQTMHHLASAEPHGEHHIQSLTISWTESQVPDLLRVCGRMLRLWFPTHAAACNPCWSLPNLRMLSAANSHAAPSIVQGQRERDLVDLILLLPAESVSTASTSTASRTHSGLPSAAELLSAVPYCWQVEWIQTGRSIHKGHALLVFTNGSGIFLVVEVRSVPLVRSGSKARGSSLSRPGRLGQAAKASKGPPGQSEDRAMSRRRRERRFAANAAEQFAAGMRGDCRRSRKGSGKTCNPEEHQEAFHKAYKGHEARDIAGTPCTDLAYKLPCVEEDSATAAEEHGGEALACPAPRRVQVPFEPHPLAHSSNSFPQHVNEGPSSSYPALEESISPNQHPSSSSDQASKQEALPLNKGHDSSSLYCSTPLPEGAIVFTAVLTSAAEGLQITAVRVKDKFKQAAVLALLLGLPHITMPLAGVEAADLTDERHLNHGRKMKRGGRGSKRRAQPVVATVSWWGLVRSRSRVSV